VHIASDVAVEEGTFTGTHHGTLHSPAGRSGLYPRAPLPRRQARFIQPAV
jgi:hypothetical protein